MKPTSLTTSLLAVLAGLIALLVNTATSADAPAKSAVAGAKETSTETKPAARPATEASTNILIFRNNRSWNRKPDFEEALTDLGHKFDVLTSADMAAADLSARPFIIIPGAQRKDGFYKQYAENAALFDQYATNGGTLLFELNGAERDGITLPGGVSMVSHGARDNSIILTNHPILDPLNGQTIHANYASHGFLQGVPKDALILASEEVDGMPALDKPTFIEYKFGKGRIIAACQCFHDQDNSGRGILMETAIAYAAEKKWYAPKR